MKANPEKQSEVMVYEYFKQVLVFELAQLIVIYLDRPGSGAV